MRRAAIQLSVVAIAATLACGGKTANEGSGGAGGGRPFDAGLAGNGGSSDGASGAAAGGTGGSASGSGGTASGGVAGSGAGAAGSGGDSGATGTGGASGTGGIGVLVDTACAAVMGTPCGTTACSSDWNSECTVEGCRATVWHMVTLTQRIGCVGDYAVALECIRANPNSCRSTECMPAQSRLTQCFDTSPRGRCMFLENPGECSIWCPAWGSVCRERPNGLECACGSGPDPDRTFMVPGQCLGDAWIAIVEEACS
jgi:hypothetical protein